jgi:hypothetical protein
MRRAIGVEEYRLLLGLYAVDVLQVREAGRKSEIDARVSYG